LLIDIGKQFVKPAHARTFNASIARFFMAHNRQEIFAEIDKRLSAEPLSDSVNSRDGSAAVIRH
jgi:hypothetical protein